MNQQPTDATASQSGISTLRFDVIAGLTAAAVVLPKAMAYATVAGLPVAVGLYTAFIPMVIYALLGSSRVLSVSSTTTLAILAGSWERPGCFSSRGDVVGNNQLRCTQLRRSDIGMEIQRERLIPRGAAQTLAFRRGAGRHAGKSRECHQRRRRQRVTTKPLRMCNGGHGSLDTTRVPLLRYFSGHKRRICHG